MAVEASPYTQGVGGREEGKKGGRGTASGRRGAAWEDLVATVADGRRQSPNVLACVHNCRNGYMDDDEKKTAKGLSLGVASAKLTCK